MVTKSKLPGWLGGLLVRSAGQWSGPQRICLSKSPHDSSQAKKSTSICHVYAYGSIQGLQTTSATYGVTGRPRSWEGHQITGDKWPETLAKWVRSSFWKAFNRRGGLRRREEGLATMNNAVVAWLMFTERYRGRWTNRRLKRPGQWQLFVSLAKVHHSVKTLTSILL